MSESPVNYFPDVTVQWTPQYVEMHATELLVSRSGREQRRPMFSSGGYRRFVAKSSDLDQNARKAVRDFLRTQRGRYGVFYFWNPPPEQYFDASVGTASNQTRMIIPYRTTNPSGGSSGTITDVRAAGVTKSFTLNHLLPRRFTYVAPYLSQSATYIDCGSGSTLKNAGDCTVAAWINPSVLTINHFILSNIQSNASGIQFRLLSNSTLDFATAFASSSTTVTSGAISGLSANSWLHVAAVKASNSVTFYANGVALSGGGAVTNQAAATVNMRLGYNYITSVTAIDAMLSDVRYYDVALSAGAIADLANNKLLPTPNANLRGWWKLIDGTGNNAADSSGYGNLGTFSPSATWVSGEEEIVWSSGQTGAVTIWGTVRERLSARYDSDIIPQGFMQDAADVRAIFDMAIKEVY